MSVEHVWLLWDLTPQIKGDPPELYDVYASGEAATKAVARLVDEADYDAESDLSVEMRAVHP